MMKKLSKILLLALIVIIAVMWLGVTFFNYGMRDVQYLTINSVDISNKADGTYSGSFEGGRWSNDVEVTIQNGQIADLAVVKDQMITRDDVWPTIKTRVLEKQNADIDHIAGATVTCKAYMRAVENALKSPNPIS